MRHRLVQNLATTLPVLAAGGDAYRLLDISEDGVGGGAQGILQAYRCR